MKDSEILLKAIQKAKMSGFEKATLETFENLYPDEVRGIIFDHRFAKAFWGVEHDFLATGTWNQECRNCHKTKTIGEFLDKECWEFGLLGMVLEENPIKYLEKFLWINQ